MFFDKIIEKLTDAKNELEQLVSQGQAHDYESYRFYIGKIQGLKDALDICQAIKRSADE